MDIRESGLSHAVKKQAKNFRVRELVKKIENHPHRQDCQADLQQNNAHNPFSEKSKKMTKEMCNVELFELCETIPTGIKASFTALAGIWHLLRENSFQSKCPLMNIRSSLNPELCHSEGATSWQSSWED